MNLNYQVTLNSNYHHLSNINLSNITTNIPSNNSKARSNSLSKNPVNNISLLLQIKTHIIPNDDKFIKKSINSNQNQKKSDRNTPNKPKLISKCDLKQYLTFSGSKQLEINNIQQNIKTNYSTANNEKSNSCRINSESSITNIMNNITVNGSNKKTILEAMKSLRFQKSSLDHQKYALERLLKSKSNLFCLLVIYYGSNKIYVK